MDSENVVCPVCTLFLRPGITLKSHLTSHPKHKVIEALVRLSNPESSQKTLENVSQSETGSQSTSGSANNTAWNQNVLPANAPAPNFSAIPGNHSFIYQQFMSSTSPQTNVLNINPLTQQVVTIPAVFNSQMMCPPYVYQQQQVIMSSGPSIMPLLPRSLPIELPASSQSSLQEHVEDVSSITIENEDNEEDEPDLVDIDIEKTNVTISVETKPKQDEHMLDRPKDEIDLKPNKFEYSQDNKENECKKTIDCETGTSDCNLTTDEYTEHNTNSPHSNGDLDWNIRVSNELDKSCQTQINNYTDIQEPESIERISQQMECKPDCYYADTIVSSANYAVLQNSYSQHEPTYTVAENHNENMYGAHTQDSNNIIDMDGMNLLISNEFLNNQLVSQVEDFDCVSSERPRVLMNIGGIETNFADHREVGDESLSRESTNIRADEHMPPRGELSGQESNGGTSDLNWNRIQYHEGSCGMSVCTSYDLIARETWDGSDVSDTEAQPVQNQSSPPAYISYDNDDTPTVSGFREPPITYKCPTCNESFNCPKERRLHQKEQHDKLEEKTKSNDIIGSQLGTKRVKKLVIKPKKSEIKTENNFDNVFTNKLKIESNLENENYDRVSVILPPNSSQVEIQKSEEVLVNDPLICTMCNTVISDSNALKQHQLEVHKFSSDIRHKCSTCGESFPNEIKYTEHLKVHPLECRLCGKYFYRRPNMQLHMKRHLGIRPYKCNICQKAFLTKQKHDEHKNIHTGNAPIKCNLCEETFRRHSNLVQHRNRHHFNLKKKLKDYVCFCGEIFHSKKKLAWHKEIHDAKPKACSQCSEKFIHMSSLTRHMRRAHNERFVPNKERHNENVECPICKGVYLRSSLDVHIRNHSGQRPFTCLICNKDFTTKWNLKLHKWTHASRMSKPFRCDQCKGAFIRESDYTAHMNSHKSIKPYTCNYCGAQFIRKYNCQRHVREHEKDKTFSCQVCGKTFHRSYYLKDHMRVHSGLRPYACHICGKTSTTKSNHNKHVRIHHAREPVSTEN